MGKKIAAMMEAHRKLFLEGAVKNNHDPQKAEELFDLMEKFGGYGFNKSHSAAYALIAFQTAFLKANYTLEFIAALMTSERGNTDAVLKYMDECRTHDIQVLPPDVNESESQFIVVKDRIRFGLAAVKGVGNAAIDVIVEDRKQNGPFESLYDFCERVPLSKVNKKVLEALIKCGAFDSIKAARSQLMAVLEEALEHGNRVQKEKADSQMDLFADSGLGAEIPASIPEMPDMEEWEEHFLLEMEKEVLGFYISGHPLDKHQADIARFATVNTLTLQEMPDGRMVRIGGMIKVLKTHKTKKGDLMAFCAIEDRNASVEVVVFPNVYALVHPILSQEQVVILEAEVQRKDTSIKLLAEKVVPIDQAAQEWTNGILIEVDAGRFDADTLERLKPIIQRYPGECTACLKICIPDKPDVLVKLSDEYMTCSDPGFFEEVETLMEKGCIETRCAPVKAKVRKKKSWGNHRNGTMKQGA
jgi:DNA polymerase-3 subunit alpha